MTRMRKVVVAIGMLAVAQVAFAKAGPKAPAEFKCGNCKAWNQPQKPFQVYGNTYYVGTKELAALLVTGAQGHVLLDGALPQSAPLIEANIKALGFHMKDVKLILNSHEHFDHAGGIAALQRASGAKVAASAVGARVLGEGAIGKDDAQYDPTQDPRIEKVSGVTVVGDDEVLTVGAIAIKAHMTPAHSPGGTTWSWTSCEKGRCLDMVYADSLNAVSADGYRFTNPDRSAQFNAVIDKVAALKCDIVISNHPDFTDTMEKAAVKTAANNPFIDPNGCRNYAAASKTRLEKRLAKERSMPAK